MKRLNKFPRKLRNYTCIALVVGVLGWSGSGVGDVYYVNLQGQASKGLNKGSFSFQTSGSSSDTLSGDRDKRANAGPEITTPVENSNNLAEQGKGSNESPSSDNNGLFESQGQNSQKDSSTESNHLQNVGSSASITNANDSGIQNPEGCADSRCDSDAYCQKFDTSSICCKGDDGDALGGKGACMSRKACEDKSKGSPSGGDSGSGNGGDGGDPPGDGGPPSGGNGGGTGGGQDFRCQKDDQCNLWCEPNTEKILIGAKCDRDAGQCYCAYLDPYQCLDSGSCEQWRHMKRSLVNCEYPLPYVCEKKSSEDKIGQCACKPQCKDVNDCQGKCKDCNGTCNCINGECKCNSGLPTR